MHSFFRHGFRCAAAVCIGVALWVLVAAPAHALDNGLARTPPMGWNSWNRFGCNVSEALIRQMADALVRTGLRDAGYRYVVIDDCWQTGRDADGNIRADPQRFPSGMKALADYVHARGLKFGLYSDAGDFTCQHRPGSHGHEMQDARRYAAWGVDYLKYDWCFTRGLSARQAYTAMRDALAATGRPIVFSICEWGLSKPWTWAAPVGNLWRTTGDIADCFDCKARWPPPAAAPALALPAVPGGGGPSAGPPSGPPPGPPPVAMGNGFLRMLDQQDGLQSAAGPGHWNDPDMLEVGNGGMSTSEYRAHFALWAMLAAPLIAGNDLRTMSAATASILGNREVIAIDQDPAGVQGHRLRRAGDADIWIRPLANGDRALALLNRGRQALTFRVDARELNLADTRDAWVRDLWRGVSLGPLRRAVRVQVAPHSVTLLRIGAGARQAITIAH